MSADSVGVDDGKAHRVVLHLIDRIAVLEPELAAEIARGGVDCASALNRVAFEQEVLRQHLALKTRLSRYLLNAHPLVALTGLVIYGLIVPLVILDI